MPLPTAPVHPAPVPHRSCHGGHLLGALPCGLPPDSALTQPEAGADGGRRVEPRLCCQPSLAPAGCSGVTCPGESLRPSGIREQAGTLVLKQLHLAPSPTTALVLGLLGSVGTERTQCPPRGPGPGQPGSHQRAWSSDWGAQVWEPLLALQAAHPPPPSRGLQSRAWGPAFRGRGDGGWPRAKGQRLAGSCGLSWAPRSRAVRVGFCLERTEALLRSRGRAW